jgi:WD40 repeat protein
MRVIDAFDGPVRAVAVSPDGRFLAAAGEFRVGAWDWVTGERVYEFRSVRPLEPDGQPAFTPAGILIFPDHRWMNAVDLLPGELRLAAPGPFSGGVAVSPDGKTVVATRAGQQRNVRLERFALPDWRDVTGFDFWSPFEKLAFSPNGEFLAGINRDSFELRIAVTGGLNGRQQATGWGHSAYLTFPRDSQTVVYGWDVEFHVMETRNGSVLRRVRAGKDQLFLDAAFLGGGRQLAVVDGTDVMHVWSAESWEVVGGYDWDAGGLACACATADGLAGVCGTDAGKLVVFDVDE